MATAAYPAVWDDEGMLTIYTRQVELVRDAGVLEQLPIHLSALALASAWAGDFAGAATLVAEADSIAAATGNRFPPYAALTLLALQGREAEATAAIAVAIEQAVAGGRGMAATTAHWAAAVLNNGLARYEEATSAALQAASDALLPWTAMWALPELVEAAVHQGDAEVARDALERLAQTTQPSGTDWALGIEARCRALVNDGDAADDLYREAIERLGRTRLHPELARAHLLHGEWLRRQQRRVDAREQLRAAYDHFTSIGMEAFAERARGELLATGETVRKRTAATRNQLTAQERQIAQLASTGLSNPEIGTRLFLSPRTVEYHLHKVFPKLGVSSRKELGNALRDPVS
jgi:DNA-binding CsgD family transcriptional regulator